MVYRRSRLLFALSLGVWLMSGCGSTAQPPVSAPEAELELKSAALDPGETIPERYTCDGEDISPPLTWGDPPANTESFALIVDDPDAPIGTWVHWVLFNIPSDRRALPGDVPAQERLSDGSVQGKNSWGRIGYGGPCPPSGSTHEYAFKLYALDTMLEVDPGAKKNEVLNAVEGHILAEGQLAARYSRP